MAHILGSPLPLRNELGDGNSAFYPFPEEMDRAYRGETNGGSEIYGRSPPDYRVDDFPLPKFDPGSDRPKKMKNNTDEETPEEKDRGKKAASEAEVEQANTDSKKPKVRKNDEDNGRGDNTSEGSGEKLDLDKEAKKPFDSMEGENLFDGRNPLSERYNDLTGKAAERYNDAAMSN
ncbi:hypothetical protein IWQ61_005777 [Dispira simplex]|nr:hypothetical protein IWQ61_005777 [Dispira simplex]